MRTALSGALGVAAFAAALSSAFGQTLALTCQGARQPRLVAELLFGRNIGDRLGVSEAAWTHFLTREVTPRFPDGLTVSEAIGQSRNPATGKIVQESSKRVEIVLPGKADDGLRLDAVVQAYRRQFHQHAVGVIVRAACVSF